jgi:hypothetical protein
MCLHSYGSRIYLPNTKKRYRSQRIPTLNPFYMLSRAAKKPSKHNVKKKNPEKTGTGDACLLVCLRLLLGQACCPLAARTATQQGCRGPDA